MIETIHSTTVIGLIHKGQSVIGGDGQVTVGNAVMKQKARKIRKIYNGTVLAGFAGAAADAFTLFERFEDRLQQYHGNLLRAAVELAKLWRTDKYLRQLEALLAVLDKQQALIISGTGEIIEPDDGIVAIGSGGQYALVAARTLKKHTDLPAKDIVQQALEAAAEICIYTNDEISIEEL
ncbi:MAG TPA: ATP-dependent protease subunit HslV [Bacteroidota bacterium]|nr:ATP-dependent protease subunit HslV [Bacteroidota bacterium]